MSAPQSSTTLKPCGLREGHRQAIAGRFTPGSLRRRSIDSAISAPVLPQLTATVASPARTDSMADHIEVSCALRITWLGLSCIVTTPAAWRMSQRSASPLRRPISRRSSGSGPWTMNRISGFLSALAAMPATTVAGPRSPPIASTDMTTLPGRSPPSVGSAMREVAILTRCQAEEIGPDQHRPALRPAT